MTTTHPAAPNPHSAAARLARTPGDMAKAVLVLLVPVALLVAVYVFFFGGNNVIAVDPGDTYSAARASAHFTVVQPAGLPGSWKPVSSVYEAGTPSILRVGYVTPSGAGIQLVESDRPADTLIKSELGSEATVARTVTVNGTVWGVVPSTNGSNLALVDSEFGRVVIIRGQASQAELTQFAAALR